ncbi:MAG: amidohydrolase family protein, partial [Acidobacteria bacterium]|nr:amidohydrolase family protein [Acidobacteriota bacterium]
MSTAIILFALLGKAQNADVAARLGYPPMIVYNGKIVTMDDDSFEPRVGTIVQAMAVRDGKILATGTNTQVRALAGPQTRQIDLKGRTVLPNFIMTHEHPHEWLFMHARPVTHVFPNDDMILFRWLPSVPPKQQLAMLEPTIKDAVAKAKPGQWIDVSMNWGPNFEWSYEIAPLFYHSVTKEWLDSLAPNHPLIVKEGVLGIVANQKALDEAKRLSAEETPRANTLEQDVMMHGKLDLLAAVQKAELEIWASWGITTFGSTPYGTSNFKAWTLLDQKGELPARWGGGYSGPSFDMKTLGTLAATLGHGTDYIWLTGAWARQGSPCTDLTFLPGADEYAASVYTAAHTSPVERNCRFAPGTKDAENMANIVKSGLRIATMHSGGDKDIEYLLDIIEQASAEVGMTAEEIRAKRHAFDHGHGAPRPDQIPRMKKLGMMASQNNYLLWKQDGHARMRSTSIFAKL